MLAQDQRQFIVTACRGCGAAGLAARRRWGDLPVCNQFGSVQPERFEMGLAQCDACGLVQLSEGPRAELLVPRLDWIKYREPEAHLDSVCKQLMSTDRAEGLSAWGVGPFDRPLLERLAEKGAYVRQLDLVGPLANRESQTFPYLETLQGLVRCHETPPALEAASADLIVFRYVIEHCDDPLDALKALRRRLKPGGRLVIEAPDSTQFLQRQDYSFLWEEHRSYFTPSTFQYLLQRAGLLVETWHAFPGELESAMVAVCRAISEDQSLDGRVTSLDPTEAQTFERFCDGFSQVSGIWREIVRSARREGGVALLGAGHQSVTFANLMGLTNDIDVVIDDDPLKQECTAPGFVTRIAPSDTILTRPDVRLCLVGLRPSLQPMLEARFPEFVARGGRFLPIARTPERMSTSRGAA